MSGWFGGAKATFFVVGNRVAGCKNTIKRAHSLGCEIGTHTWSHKNLTKLTAEQINEEMNKSADAITSITGAPVKLMRPPEGAMNSAVQSKLAFPIIMWSVDSMDWKHRNAAKDYNSVVNSVFDGCIILMHDLYPATAEAVEKIIPDLMAKGYKFVTVSELFEARGRTLQNGKRYSQARP
jgi:peptidoglycan/xylan/chitin deacetylase (PgdA/CDA1 family)